MYTSPSGQRGARINHSLPNGNVGHPMSSESSYSDLTNVGQTGGTSLHSSYNVGLLRYGRPLASESIELLLLEFCLYTYNVGLAVTISHFGGIMPPGFS